MYRAALFTKCDADLLFVTGKLTPPMPYYYYTPDACTSYPLPNIGFVPPPPLVGWPSLMNTSRTHLKGIQQLTHINTIFYNYKNTGK